MHNLITPLMSQYFAALSESSNDFLQAQAAVSQAIVTVVQGLADMVDNEQRDDLCKLLSIASDELMLNSSTPFANQWLDKPLSKYPDGGEWFFIQVEGYLREPAIHTELLMVCHSLLAYGYKGKYIQRPENHLRMLQRKIRDAFQLVPQASKLSKWKATLSPKPIGAAVFFILVITGVAVLCQSWRQQQAIVTIYQHAQEK